MTGVLYKPTETQIRIMSMILALAKRDKNMPVLLHKHTVVLTSADTGAWVYWCVKSNVSP